MGCDIHLYVETRHPITGQWRAHGKFINEYPDDEDSVPDTPYKESFYTGRNYDLFAILADVRNGRGFAGIKTGDGFVPIAMPRGMPDDVSPQVRACSDALGCDGHSHSHHTLRQLLDYDWTQTTKQRGWCDVVEWEKWSRWDRGQGIGPSTYCGAVSGRGVQHLTAAEMDARIETLQLNDYGDAQTVDERRAIRGAKLAKLANCYALAEWTDPYSRAAGTFVSETIPRLLALVGGTAGLDNVRIVFWFDN